MRNLMANFFVLLLQTSSILVIAFQISSTRVRHLAPSSHGAIDQTTYCRSVEPHFSSSSIPSRTPNDVQCWTFPRKRTSASSSRITVTTTTTLYDSSSVESDLETSFSSSSASDSLDYENGIHVESNGHDPTSIDGVSNNGISVNGFAASVTARNGFSSPSNNGHSIPSPNSNGSYSGRNGVGMDRSRPTGDMPVPTANGGYTHTSASKAKISAANKGKTPWNKGKQRSPEVKARIAAGVRARNRERFLKKLEDMGVTEEEYEAQKKEERRKKEAERRARRTEKGGYRPTEETKKKISKIIKEKYAKGEMKPRKVDPSKVRRGFTHSEETRAKISESLKKRWANDGEYRQNQINQVKTRASTKEVKQKISESLKKKWQDPEFRQEMMDKRFASGQYENRARPTYSDAHRAKISQSMKARWEDPAYRTRALESIAKRRKEQALLKPPAAPRPKQPKKPRGAKASTAKAAKKATKKQKERAIRVLEPMLKPKPKPVRKAKNRTVERREKLSEASASATTAVSADPVSATPLVSIEDVAEPSDLSIPESKPVPTSPPATAKAAPAKKKATKKAAKKKASKGKPKAKKEPDGSVSRLKEERRDLFDLLYGDDYYEDGEATAMAKRSFSLGDENLDDFDPYGLEDY